MTVKMYHPFIQPASQSPCSLRLHRCSHLCLASPQVPHLPVTTAQMPHIPLTSTQVPHVPLSTAQMPHLPLTSTQIPHLSVTTAQEQEPHLPLASTQGSHHLHFPPAAKRRRGVPGPDGDPYSSLSRCVCPVGLVLAANGATCVSPG